MMRLSPLFVGLAAAAAVSCGGGTSDVARNLPAGDAEKGRQAFVELQCTTCHEVAGGGLPAPSTVPPVALGGRTLLPPSAERLAEDILLPSSHFAEGYPAALIMQDGQSRMPDYSKALTKEQVANLAAFLESRYERGLPSPTR